MENDLLEKFMNRSFSERFSSVIPSSDRSVPAPAFPAPCWCSKGTRESVYPTGTSSPILIIFKPTSVQVWL